MAETVTQNAAEYFKKDRSYHETFSPYPLPNDTTEHQRLDEQGAAALALMNNQLLHAPVAASASRILDVGCGTGATTIQLARQFPAATAIGLDLSPVPALLSSPSSPPSSASLTSNNNNNNNNNENVRAVQGDFLDPTFFARHPDVRAGSFDLVFSRFLVMGVNDWDAFYRRAHDALAPGGWVETQDVDQVWYRCDEEGAGAPRPRPRRCSDAWLWLRAMTDAAGRRGLDMECASNAAGRMEAVGLVDVRTERFVLPLGEWDAHPEADAAARFARRTLRESLRGALVRMLREDGVDEGRVGELSDGVLGDEVWDKGVHRYLTVTWGRKP